jgi:hypothetical protein
MNDVTQGIFLNKIGNDMKYIMYHAKYFEIFVVFIIKYRQSSTTIKAGELPNYFYCVGAM